MSGLKGKIYVMAEIHNDGAVVLEDRGDFFCGREGKVHLKSLAQDEACDREVCVNLTDLGVAKLGVIEIDLSQAKLVYSKKLEYK